MNIRRYLPLTVFSIWLATLAWLLQNDNFQLFLKPSFKGLVTAGFVFTLCLCAGLVIHLFQSKHAGPAKHSWINGLILLLPVVFIFPSGQNTLGQYAMQKRSMAASAVQKEQHIETIAPDQDPLRLPPETQTKAKPDEDQTGPNQDKDTAISVLVREFDRFDGKAVSIQGLFAKTVSGHDELSAVFRYLITCCVADAMPVGVFISSKVAQGTEDNQWVRVKGKVELRKMDGFDVIYMDADTVQPLEMPDKKAVYIYN